MPAACWWYSREIIAALSARTGASIRSRFSICPQIDWRFLKRQVCCCKQGCKTAKNDRKLSSQEPLWCRAVCRDHDLRRTRARVLAAVILVWAGGFHARSHIFDPKTRLAICFCLSMVICPHLPTEEDSLRLSAEDVVVCVYWQKEKRLP